MTCVAPARAVVIAVAQFCRFLFWGCVGRAAVGPSLSGVAVTHAMLQAAAVAVLTLLALVRASDDAECLLCIRCMCDRIEGDDTGGVFAYVPASSMAVPHRGG